MSFVPILFWVSVFYKTQNQTAPTVELGFWVSLIFIIFAITFDVNWFDAWYLVGMKSYGI